MAQSLPVSEANSRPTRSLSSWPFHKSVMEKLALLVLFAVVGFALTRGRRWIEKNSAVRRVGKQIDIPFPPLAVALPKFRECGFSLRIHKFGCLAHQAFNSLNLRRGGGPVL